MLQKLYVLFFLGLSVLFPLGNNALFDLTDDEFLKSIDGRYYQPIIVNGEIVNSQCVCDCSIRYKVVKAVCDKLKHPIKLLDIGAAQGFFSFKVVSDYNAHATMVDQGNDKQEGGPSTADFLLRLVTLQDMSNNFQVIPLQLHATNIQSLAIKEKYDLVLAFNIIHHIPGNGVYIINKIRALGKNVLIEIPDVLSKLWPYAEREGGQLVGSFSRRIGEKEGFRTKMYLFKR